METVQLQRIGLTELRYSECEEVNGGGWIWEALLKAAIAHANEVFDGFTKGLQLEIPKN